MAIIQVPFHQDEHVAESSIPVRFDTPCYPVTPLLPEGDLWERLAYLYQEVAVEIEEEAKRDSVPIVLSGDCLVSLGVLTGLQRAGIDPAVVWFDAHGDVHTMASSTSGYPGGMALRFLMGADYDLLGAKLGFQPLAEDRAVLVDARDLDPAEAGYLRTSEVKHCSVDNVQLPDGPFILHIDADVIDAAEVPKLRYPVGNGPSKDAVLTALREIRGSGRVVAIDIACPWEDDDSLQDVRHALIQDLISG